MGSSVEEAIKLIFTSEDRASQGAAAVAAKVEAETQRINKLHARAIAEDMERTKRLNLEAFRQGEAVIRERERQAERVVAAAQREADAEARAHEKKALSNLNLLAGFVKLRIGASLVTGTMKGIAAGLDEVAEKQLSGALAASVFTEKFTEQVPVLGQVTQAIMALGKEINGTNQLLRDTSAEDKRSEALKKLLDYEDSIEARTKALAEEKILAEAVREAEKVSPADAEFVRAKITAQQKAAKDRLEAEKEYQRVLQNAGFDKIAAAAVDARRAERDKEMSLLVKPLDSVFGSRTQAAQLEVERKYKEDVRAIMLAAENQTKGAEEAKERELARIAEIEKRTIESATRKRDAEISAEQAKAKAAVDAEAVKIAEIAEKQKEAAAERAAREVEAAAAARAKAAASIDISNAEEVARLKIQLEKDGLDETLALLELKKQKEIENAEAVGASVQAINEKYGLLTKIAVAENAPKAPLSDLAVNTGRTPTTAGAALEARFLSGGSASSAQEQTAKNTAKIAQEMKVEGEKTRVTLADLMKFTAAHGDQVHTSGINF